MKSNEAHILAEMADATRDLVFIYVKNIPKENWHKEFTLDGIKYNSIAWQLAHMAWAEDNLILVATGGKNIERPWFDKVKIGAPQASSSELPGADEIEETLKLVHEKSVEQIKSLTDEQLQEPNLTGLSFKRGNTKRMSIIHHIRHDGMHIGQISLLVKMHGVKTF